jgi:hypothetical protein
VRTIAEVEVLTDAEAIRHADTGDLGEFGPDGRLVRQVAQHPGGPVFRYDSWPFNPPIDLHDPALVSREIPAEDIERAWSTSVPDPDEAD